MGIIEIISKINKYILGTNWFKTFRINIHYFSFRQAIKLPILVSRRSVFQQLMGRVEIRVPLKTGMLLFGYQSLGAQDPFYERTVWQVSGTILLDGYKINIGRGSKFCVSGICILGDHLSVTGRSTIICRKKMQFGKNNLISWDVLLMDTDFHKILDHSKKVINKDKQISIGDNVWIGCRATLLKGSNIPANSIIAAGAVISGKLAKEGCIYTSEKRILKEIGSWEI